MEMGIPWPIQQSRLNRLTGLGDWRQANAELEKNHPDIRGRFMKPKSRLVETVVLLVLTIALSLPAWSQSPLGVAYVDDPNIGGSGVYTHFQLTFSAGPVPGDGVQFQPYSHIFEFTTNDVGRMFTLNDTSDPDFATLASILTNGQPAGVSFSYWFWVGSTNNGAGN